MSEDKEKDLGIIVSEDKGKDLGIIVNTKSKSRISD